MERMLVALALAVTLTACAEDGRDLTSDAATAPTSGAGSDPAATDPSSTDATTATTMPPDADPGGTMPDPTDTSPGDSMPLELEPDKPTPPTAPPTGSVPGGDEEAWFAGQVDPGLAPFVDLAVADLAERLDVLADDVTTVSAVLVTWPDASLGCPDPDMMYAQVLEDGSLIELDHAGTIYRYHSGGSLPPFLCEASVMPTTVVGITDGG